MIVARIDMDDDHSSQCSGKTIEEVIEKIKSFHTLDDTTKQYFVSKGWLDEELGSGWYLTSE